MLLKQTVRTEDTHQINRPLTQMTTWQPKIHFYIFMNFNYLSQPADLLTINKVIIYIYKC